jgi:large subunit ribosomal protein L22
MPYTAKHNHARIAPRKARLVMDMIRGKSADDAINILQFSKKRAAVMISRVVKSAVANYNDQETAPSGDVLFVSEARVDPGPVMKRFQPKDRGKSYSIMKRTSHLIVSVDPLDVEEADEVTAS